MKKTLLCILTFAAFNCLRLNAQFTITNLNLPVQHPGVAVVDVDGDGDLDILISGENGPDRTLKLFRNNGAGVYTADTLNLIPTTRTTFSFGDINQDGKLDLNMAGFPAVGPAVDSIYTSNGAGVFTKDNAIVLPQAAPSAGFADLNNDGYTDIYVFGNGNFGHPKIFFNNKAGGFVESDQFNAYDFTDPVVVPVDFDNDKDLDLFVIAYDNGTNSRFTTIFVNNNGTFTPHNFGFNPKSNGSITWADYNGDGYLDVLYNGDGVPGDDWKYLLYKNNAGTSFTFVDSLEYRQDHTGNGGRMVDWDNDGDIDLIVTGYNGSRQATDIYLNNNGVFTPYSGNATIPGVSENSIETADVDGDGDLDIIESGFSGNDYNGTGSAFNTNVSLIIKNPTLTKNSAPSVPTGLKVSGNQSAINFGWNASTDATTPQKAISYNMYLTDDKGKWYYDPLADTLTGKLALQRMGNVELNKGWIIKNLPAGNYCWGVQAIDNSFAASKFARSCFTIKTDGTLPVTISDFSVAADGNRTKIAWTTALEQNSDYFKIEHSTDGHNFSMLTNIKALGNSSVSHNYVTYDDYPAKGINYYRLTYYDKEGKGLVYDVKTVTFNVAGKTLVEIYPNPVVNNIGFKLANYNGAQVSVTLTDIAGKILHKETIQTNGNANTYKLNLQGKLTSGTYILHVSGDNLNEGLKVIVN